MTLLKEKGVQVKPRSMDDIKPVKRHFKIAEAKTERLTFLALL